MTPSFSARFVTDMQAQGYKAFPDANQIQVGDHVCIEGPFKGLCTRPLRLLQAGAEALTFGDGFGPDLVVPLPGDFRFHVYCGRHHVGIASRRTGRGTGAAAGARARARRSRPTRVPRAGRAR